MPGRIDLRTVLGTPKFALRHLRRENLKALRRGVPRVPGMLWECVEETGPQLLSHMSKSMVGRLAYIDDELVRL